MSQASAELTAEHPHPAEGPDPDLGAPGDDIWWPQAVVAAVALPVVVFLMLQPERYGTLPNTLDPFFYTGYAINFDDIFREIGDGRYFVSRWSVYLPSRAFSSVFGPSSGRLILRWVVAAGVLLSIWHVGRQWKWNRATEITIGVIALTTPMFARAFLTDYVEWFIVGIGIVMLCQCLEPAATPLRSAAIGALVALIVVANPLAATITVAPVVFFLLNGTVRTRSLRAVMVRTSLLVVSGAATVLLGWLLFRVRYHMDNVYEPTLDYLDAEALRDPLKSPTRSWLGDFTWLYVPPLLIGGALLIPATRELLRTHRAAAAAIAILAFQYAVQWLDQFGRDGNGLEISYYWSFIVPSLTVATAVVLGSLRLTWRSSALLLTVWFVIILQPWPLDVDLPGGSAFAVTLLVIVAAVATAARRSPLVAGGLVVVAGLCFQVAAPSYDPASYHFFNASPQYDAIYFNADSMSDKKFSEAVWLENQLDELPTDVGISFLPSATTAESSAADIIGIYGAQVTGKWLKTGEDGQASTDTLNQLDAGTVPLVAVYGESEFVQATLDTIDDLNPQTEILLDATHGGGLGHRLAVVAISPPDYDDFTWQATALAAQTGQDVDGVRTARPERDPAGMLVFGPGATLADQRYRLTLQYSSAASPTAGEVGAFDVAVHGESVARASVVGTDGERAAVTLDFTAAAGPGWDFRTTWFGESPLDVFSVRIERLP